MQPLIVRQEFSDKFITTMTFFDEIKIYFIWGSFVQFFWAVVAAPFIYLIAPRFSRESDHKLIYGYALLNVFLLLWGSIGSAIFMYVASGKLYISVDRLVDFYPFIPFGDWILDDGFGGEWHGRLLGDTTIWDIRLVWLAVALPVWLLAFISTKLSLPRFLSHFGLDSRKISKKPNKPAHPTAGNVLL